MFLLDYKNLIFNYLAKGNTRILLPDDLKKINEASDNEVVDLELLKLSLKLFEDNKILIKQEYKDGKNNKILYAAEKPLSFFEQTLYLSGSTAGYIANAINNLKDKNDKTIICDPLKIEEKDVLQLLSMLVNSIENKTQQQTEKQQTHGLN